MRIVVRLEWKMTKSSEVSRAIERAPGTDEKSVLFGRNQWIYVQYKLTTHSRQHDGTSERTASRLC